MCAMLLVDCEARSLREEASMEKKRNSRDASVDQMSSKIEARGSRQREKRSDDS
jgi:hypothetical protein